MTIRQNEAMGEEPWTWFNLSYERAEYSSLLRLSRPNQDLSAKFTSLSTSHDRSGRQTIARAVAIILHHIRRILSQIS
jgi:hypothetical protein